MPNLLTSFKTPWLKTKQTLKPPETLAKEPWKPLLISRSSPFSPLFFPKPSALRCLQRGASELFQLLFDVHQLRGIRRLLGHCSDLGSSNWQRLEDQSSQSSPKKTVHVNPFITCPHMSPSFLTLKSGSWALFLTLPVNRWLSHELSRQDLCGEPSLGWIDKKYSLRGWIRKRSPRFCWYLKSKDPLKWQR